MGPSKKCYGDEEYIRILSGLLLDAEYIEVKKIIEQKNGVLIFYDLGMENQGGYGVPVAEYHKVINEKIINVQSTFDGKPITTFVNRNAQNIQC